MSSNKAVERSAQTSFLEQDYLPSSVINNATVLGFLQNAQEHVKELNVIDRIQGDLKSYEPNLQRRVDKAVDTMVDHCQFVDENAGLSSEESKALKKYFQNSIYLANPLYSQSHFFKLGFTKPKGFPGQFDMLEGIYENVPLSKGLGEYLDRFFLKQALAAAVRGRKDKIRDMLADAIIKRREELSILSIASDPCREWYELLPTVNAKGVTFTAIDFDDEALDFSKRRLESLNSGVKLIFANEDLRNWKDDPQKPINAFGGKDIVYSVGLYDYLPDDLLMGILLLQNAMLKDNGQMIVAFKDCSKYVSVRYDWFVDWHFKQRTEADVDALLAKLGYRKDHVRKSREPSGIIVFYQICKL
jgi:hypothetical protein